MQYSPASLTSSPFAVLTAVVAPAILTNACSVLSLGTSNRVARAVDRTRFVANELAKVEAGTPEFQLWTNQLVSLQERTQLLMRSLRLFYAAVGLFAAAALLTLTGALLGHFELHVVVELVVMVAFGSGALAVICLSSGCVLMVAEGRKAVHSLSEEAHAISSKYKP